MLPLAILLLTAAEPPAVAATVNGEAIPLSRVDNYIRTKLAVLPASASEHRRLRADVLNDLIDDALLKQFLDKNAPKVDDAEIDKLLKAFTASLQRKGKSLERFLKDTNQTEAELRNSWLLTAQLDGWIRQSTSEVELKKYWTEHRDHFDRTETKASHILLRLGQKPTGVELAKAKEKLEAVQKDVAAGKIEFKAAAKKHSQCPSATNGGDIGWFPRTGAMVEEFAKAAFKLKPGEMGIVQTEFGIHLVLVTDRKAGKPSEFEKCISEVRELYADEQRTALPRTLRRDATIKITLP